MRSRLKNDILLIGGFLLAAALFALLFFATRKEGAYAAVLKNGTEIARYSLAEEGEYPILEGDAVTNLLVIADGKAQMTEAVCPDQICVHHRPISKAGETIVCLPHEVVVKIEAEGGDAPDMVV